MRLCVVIAQYSSPVPRLKQVHQKGRILEVMLLVADPDQVARAPVKRDWDVAPWGLLERRLDVFVVDGRPGNRTLDRTGIREGDTPPCLLVPRWDRVLCHDGNSVRLVRDGRPAPLGVAGDRINGDMRGPACFFGHVRCGGHIACRNPLILLRTVNSREQLVQFLLLLRWRSRLSQERWHHERIEVFFPNRRYRRQQRDGVILHETIDQIPRRVRAAPGGIIIPPAERADEPLPVAPGREALAHNGVFRARPPPQLVDRRALRVAQPPTDAASRQRQVVVHTPRHLGGVRRVPRHHRQGDIHLLTLRVEEGARRRVESVVVRTVRLALDRRQAGPHVGRAVPRRWVGGRSGRGGRHHGEGRFSVLDGDRFAPPHHDHLAGFRGKKGGVVAHEDGNVLHGGGYDNGEAALDDLLGPSIIVPGLSPFFGWRRVNIFRVEVVALFLVVIVIHCIFITILIDHVYIFYIGRGII
mmetsp:Transcript_27976/g.59438  ORF Transcript_27976/g.59438 Transcript_27976/m.59438 type:complete len:470 (+) Transcript_27976:1525-2934(+)